MMITSKTRGIGGLELRFQIAYTSELNMDRTSLITAKSSNHLLFHVCSGLKAVSGKYLFKIFWMERTATAL